jgi:hypothetical protein
VSSHPASDYWHRSRHSALRADKVSTTRCRPGLRRQHDVHRPDGRRGVVRCLRQRRAQWTGDSHAAQGGGGINHRARDRVRK